MKLKIKSEYCECFGHIATELYSYDVWGCHCNPLNWTDYHVPAPRLISRGYTGHEHLDGFGLLNMNGRMCDPVIGRVLSPDIAVQAPGFTQSYNRYSYCMNNPLRYTDPSGWYTAADINSVINELWNSQYGGSWTPGSAAVPYTASEGFGYFVAYNEANGWAAGSSMGSSLSNYFVSDASAVSALGLSNKVTNFDASMLCWQLSPTGLYTNYQSFNNNMSFQLVVDGNNKVVYYNSTGFVVPVVDSTISNAEQTEKRDGYQIVQKIVGVVDFTVSSTYATVSTVQKLGYGKVLVKLGGKEIAAKIPVVSALISVGQGMHNGFKTSNYVDIGLSLGMVALDAALLTNPVGWTLTALSFGADLYSEYKYGESWTEHVFNH